MLIVYILDVLQSAPLYHLGINVFLFWFVLWVIVHPSYYPHEWEIVSEDDLQAMIDDWNPEPLAMEVSKDHPALNPRITTSKVKKVLTIDQVPCLNFATHDYLNFIGKESIEKKAIETISKYGVGTCGPRGFYGTFDVHLELEKKIANFMNMEEAVLYSYGFSTIASAIPAYAKKGDIIFVDERVNFAIQKGMDASRSTLKFFKHNNIQHLEDLLFAQEKYDRENPNKANTIKKFLIVEGIYMNTGEMCPLPDMMILREKYKLRIFIDESVSFGTLGDTGRGITEYFDIPPDSVDMIMCSMEKALATIGGFCVGSTFVVDHQRLSGLGYCFSASLPPLLTVAALEALDIMKNDVSMFSDLKKCCEDVHKAIRSIKQLKNISHIHSPIKHLVLPFPCGYKYATDILQDISKFCIDRGVAVIVPTYLENVEKFRPVPSIRVTVNNQLTENVIDRLRHVLQEACDYVMVSSNMICD